MTNYEFPQMKYPEQKGLVSIIVPIYNNETSLNECLNSILSQTFTNWEAILVNDGSIDNTGKIIDEYVKKDSRFIAINKQNQGTLLARKTGLENSKGEFIANIDHDDIYNQQFLEKMYAKIIETNADFVWCNFCHGSTIINLDSKWNAEASENVKAMLISMAFDDGNMSLTWNKLIKREVYAKVRFPNVYIIGGEDPIQIMQVAYYSKLAVFVPENLYFHREAGISSKANDPIFNFKANIHSFQAKICFIQIAKTIFNGVIPKDVYCLFRGIAYYFFLLNKKEREIFENEFKPFLPILIKQEKLRIRICLLLANEGIEFPFKFYHYMKYFYHYINLKLKEIFRSRS